MIKVKSARLSLAFVNNHVRRMVQVLIEHLPIRLATSGLDINFNDSFFWIKAGPGNKQLVSINKILKIVVGKKIYQHEIIKILPCFQQNFFSVIFSSFFIVF